jgi:hypothetical protein
MRIDAMAHRTVERVAQREFDGISPADPDSDPARFRYRQIMVSEPLGEEPADRAGFQLDMNRHRLLPVDRRSNRGRGQSFDIRGQIGNLSLVATKAEDEAAAGFCASCAWA